jgi:phosphatidylcholine synthase
MSTDGAAAAQTARRARAFGVHVFTASGAIVALLAMRATAAGDLDQAVLWMLAALFIDGIDGTLARRWDVGRLVPQVDGRRLDDIVDYLNYVVVPAFFLIQAELVPAWAWVALPVLASAYGFARSDAKTADHYFLGFPSYWNVVAIYAWKLGTTPPVVAAWLTMLAVAVFVPVRYLYPSRMRGPLGVVMNLGAVAWMGAIAAIALWPDAAATTRLAWISLVYPAVYVGLSFWIGGLQRTPPAP